MANKFKEKAIEAEILGNVYDRLEDDLKNCTMRYDAVGKKDVQARDWRTNELLWEDEECTIPKYHDKYDYVPIPEDELTDDMKLKREVIKKIMAKLEKLV